MNAYGLLVLVALILEWAAHRLAGILTLRSLSPEVPGEVAEFYDAERYAKSQEYTRVRTRFGQLSSTLRLVALLVFWQLGGFAWLDDVVRGLGWSPVPTGLAYIGALMLGGQVLSLPLELWSTFRIEERFGFNRTDARTFWLDRIKGLLLMILLGGPLLAVVLVFFESAGSLAWLWAWVAVTVFLIGVQTIVPTWILPLFNKFEPLDEGELRSSILDYARRVSFPLEGIFVIDGSRRSSKANAFFTGFGKRKRIALFDTLIEHHPVPELVAVVAHEIGHYKRKHIVQSLVVSILHTGAVLLLLGLFLRNPGLHAAFGVEEPAVWTGLVFFGLLYTPIELGLSVGLLALSRRNEFQADAYALETTGLGEALCRALSRLSAENLSNLTPHPLEVVLGHSHPPVLRRLQAIREAAKE